MWESIRTIPLDDYEALERMADSGDQTFVPVLVELLFSFVPESREGIQEIEDTLRLLTGESYDDFDWNEWIKWVGRNDEVTPPTGFDGWKGELFEMIDPSFGDFLYEGVPNRIRLEEIRWGGVRKDGIPDLRFPPNIPGDSAGYLESQDRVHRHPQDRVRRGLGNLLDIHAPGGAGDDDHALGGTIYRHANVELTLHLDHFLHKNAADRDAVGAGLEGNKPRADQRTGGSGGLLRGGDDPYTAGLAPAPGVYLGFYDGPPP